MELKQIRKELDKLDKSLDYIILFRLSLAVLVGEIKEKQHLPLYQPEREKEIYNFQKQFSEQTGADPELLGHVFQELIAAAMRIEKNAEHYCSESEEIDVNMVESELYASNQILSDFIAHMDSVKQKLHGNHLTGDKVLASLAKYDKNRLNSSRNE